MSDFLSRLVARSSGEKSAVRPRILPGFAGRHEIAEQLPAGEVLHGAPEVQPTIAPLPVQNSHRMSPNRRSSEIMNNVPAAPAPRDTSRAGTEVPGVLDQQQTKVVETQRTLLPASQEKTVVTVQSPVTKPRMGLEERLHGDTTIEPTQVEHGPAMVIQTVAVTRETKEVVKVISETAEPVLGPPNFPVVRPSASKFEMPLEASRTRPTSEPPAIQVTIGKIEVRASIAEPRPGEKKIPKGVLSLEEYQRLRSRRSAG